MSGNGEGRGAEVRSKSGVVYTIGHSTRSLEELISILFGFGVDVVIDVRTIPRSRHNPQFNTEVFQESLKSAGIGYEHWRQLGGLRHPMKISPNGAWRNDSFRGFADYMLGEEFTKAIDALVSKASSMHCAILCAEAVPWRCHRSLIGDALMARGVKVEHIMGPRKTITHVITPWAVVEGLQITYPPAV